MRVVTTAPELAPLGGVELSTFQGARALAERGHEVVLLFGTEGPQRADYEAAGIPMHGGFDFEFDPASPLRSLRRFLPAARLLRRLRPDVLWLNRAEHVIWASVVSLLAGVPVVCHLRHAPNYRRVGLVYRRVAHFLAVSEYTRGDWIARGIGPRRISVLHNAVRPEDYPVGDETDARHSRELLGIPSGAPVLLYYGRLVRDKGIETLLDAWLELGEANTAAGPTLVLVGGADDETSAHITAALAHRPLDASRWFPLADDVVPYLHAADVVVLPTTSPEPFGRVVIEAMATGRPVVASRVGGIPEILSGGMERLLVEPGDAAALATRLAGLLTWRRDEPQFGAACTEWVADRFTQQRQVDRLESVLARVAATRRPGVRGRVRARSGKSSSSR